MQNYWNRVMLSRLFAGIDLAQALTVIILVNVQSSFVNYAQEFPLYYFLRHNNASNPGMSNSGYWLQTRFARPFNIPTAISVMLIVSTASQIGISLYTATSDLTKEAIDYKFYDFGFTLIIILMSVAVQVGVTDIFTLVAIAVLTYFGVHLMIHALIMSENDSSKADEIVQTGAMILLSSWLIIIGTYALQIAQDKNFPVYIHVILWIMWVFCVVFTQITRNDLLTRGEYRPRQVTTSHYDFMNMQYDVLFFLIRILFTWIVLGTVLAGTA
jgi:hypothetical protein